MTEGISLRDKSNNSVVEALTSGGDLVSVEYLHVVLIEMREHVVFITGHAQDSIAVDRYPLMERSQGSPTFRTDGLSLIGGFVSLCFDHVSFDLHCFDLFSNAEPRKRGLPRFQLFHPRCSLWQQRALGHPFLTHTCINPSTWYSPFSDFVVS
jgi:hypothetical protein